MTPKTPSYIKIFELPDAMIETRLHHIFWCVADFDSYTTETWTMMFTGPFALQKVVDHMKETYPGVQLWIQRMLVLDARDEVAF